MVEERGGQLRPRQLPVAVVLVVPAQELLLVRAAEVRRVEEGNRRLQRRLRPQRAGARVEPEENRWVELVVDKCGGQCRLRQSPGRGGVGCAASTGPSPRRG